MQCLKSFNKVFFFWAATPQYTEKFEALSQIQITQQVGIDTRVWISSEEFRPKQILKTQLFVWKKCIHWHLFLLCDRIKLPTSQKKQEGCWQHIIILYPFRGQKFEFFRETFNPFYIIRILVCYIFAWIRSASTLMY